MMPSDVGYRNSTIADLKGLGNYHLGQEMFLGFIFASYFQEIIDISY